MIGRRPRANERGIQASIAARVSRSLLITSAASALTVLAGCRLFSSSYGNESRPEAKSSKMSRKEISQCIREAARARDWEADPAIVRVDAAPGGKFDRTLYALSDIHGHFDAFFELLLNAGVIAQVGDVPKPSGFTWQAGNAVLVLAGDLINKGTQSVKAMKFAQNLERKAAEAGGRAIFLAGNHEVGFIGNPLDTKFDEFVSELGEEGLTKLCEPRGGDEGEAAKEAFGIWLSRRPAAAIVGGVFLSHSGWTQMRKAVDIAADFAGFVKAQSWDAPFLCGRAGDAQSSDPQGLGFFNANAWWERDGVLDRAAEEMGVKQIAFGHDPKAFSLNGFEGDIGGFFGDETSGRALVNLDVGIFQGYATAGLLKCDAQNWRAGGGCAAFEKMILPKNYKAAKRGSYPWERVRVAPGRPKIRAREPRIGC